MTTTKRKLDKQIAYEQAKLTSVRKLGGEWSDFDVQAQLARVNALCEQRSAL